MKKKVLMVIAAATTISMLAGCGNETQTEAVAEVEEITVEEEVEENTEDVNSETEETKTEPATETETETEEEEGITADDSDFVFTESYALEKINKAIEAHNEIVNHGRTENVPFLVESMCESWGNELYQTNADLAPVSTEDQMLKSAEGTTNFETGDMITIGLAYYDNYINNDTGWYDITDWFKDQSLEELQKETGMLGLDDSSNAILGNLPIVINYIINQGFELSSIDYIDTNEYTYKPGGYEPFFRANITLGDGDDNFYFVFDKDGKLIQLESNNWDDKYYVYSYKTE